MENVIPKPRVVKLNNGKFTIRPTASIYFEPDVKEVRYIAQYLAERLRPATGYAMNVIASTGPIPEGNIQLIKTDRQVEMGAEGYALSVAENALQLEAEQPAGLFYGVQTIRQMLPAAIEAKEPQSGPWEITTGTIQDRPRFAWRGMMLDVARHFFGIEDIKCLIDLMAGYKLNRLHLHLSDDQGWRVMIHSWPNLASHGGSSHVEGGAGGYYSQAELAEIVGYAKERFIQIIPEIDMPGHTNAALASYAELNCDGQTRALYNGIEVGFSSLCIDKEITYRFVEDVVREISALTDGEYFHIGGDEAKSTPTEDFVRFIERIQPILKANGKCMVGWEEIVKASLADTTLVQFWVTGQLAQEAARQGIKLIMSPATKTYLDMKYNPATELGLSWAGFVSVHDAYHWDPATAIDGINEEDIIGVESPLWSETLLKLADVEFMAFPRLLGHAEIGWSPAGSRDWNEYRLRLGAHGHRLQAMGINFYPAPEVPWQ